MGRLIVALVLCFAAPLAAQSTGLVTVALDSRSGGVDSGEIYTAGGQVTVQVCGGQGADAFTGSFVVRQGMASGRLAETHSSGPIVAMAGCGAAGLVQLPIEARITQVVVTLDSGRQSTWLYWSRRAVQGEGSK